MKKPVRQGRIIEMVERNGYLSVGDAAAALSVTMQTIRRDFEELIQFGAIVRHRGGATPNLAGKVANYSTRRTYLGEVKKQLARRAVTLIPDGASLFIQSGTTLEAVGPLLSQTRLARIVTNNVHLALLLTQQDIAPVHVPGGQVRATDGAVLGEQAVAGLGDYRFDIALLGAAGVDADGSLLDYELHDVAIARAALAASAFRVLVADVTKFKHTAPLRTAPMSALHAVVTDAPPPQAVRTVMDAAGVALHLAAA